MSVRTAYRRKRTKLSEGVDHTDQPLSDDAQHRDTDAVGLVDTRPPMPPPAAPRMVLNLSAILENELAGTWPAMRQAFLPSKKTFFLGSNLTK